ncbi:MAG TPA: hypothetical protein VGG85_18270 [Terracidiphilus sp.]|jgi:hypothetical protein
MAVVALTITTINLFPAQSHTQDTQVNRVAEKNPGPTASKSVPPEKASGNTAPSVAGNVQTFPSTAEKDAAAEQENLDIQRKLELFTGVLAVVAVLQFFTMFWQGLLLRGTLGKIKEQADIAKATLVSSFRPKIVLRRISLNPRNLKTYQAADNGIWKIELLLVNTGSTKATIETFRMEFEWIKDDPLPWQDQPTAICAHTWSSFVIPAAGRHPLELAIPYDNGFPATFDLMVQMLASPYSSGSQGAWPTCRGTIIYADENGHKRQTGFYRKWNITAERFEVSEDPDLEYQD